MTNLEPGLGKQILSNLSFDIQLLIVVIIAAVWLSVVSRVKNVPDVPGANLPPPTLLSPSNGATGISQSPTFSWTAVSGATSYRILVATSAAALPTDPTASTCSCVINATPTGTSYSASGLSAGTTYYWEVHGRSSAQFGDWSAKFSFTTVSADTTPPTISAFSVSPSSTVVGEPFTISYTISDSGGSGLNRADLWRAPDNGGVAGTWALIRSNSHSGNGPVSSSFADSPPSAGTYWYGLHVVDNAGNVRIEPNPPGPIRVTVLGNLPSPTLLNPSNGATGLSQSPTFSWTAVSGATSYRILVATSAAALPTDPTASTCSCVINATPTGTSYSASGLSAGTTYYWEVHGRSSAQFGNWSAKFSFTTVSGDTTPPTISAFSVSTVGIALGDSLTISYTISDSGGSGLSRAELYRAPDNGGTPGTWSGLRANSHSGNGPVSSSFADTPPSSGVYWYGLHAIDNAGNVRIEPNPPGPIRVTVGSNLPAPTLSNPSNGASNVNQPVNFSWSLVAGASSYRILVATSAAALPTDPTTSTCNCVINGTPSGTSYSASGLSAGTTYYWEVHGRSSSQYGTWSAKHSFTTGTSADTTPPSITAFNVSPSSVNLGISFNIAYTISDTGGSGLSRAELWRAPDSGGSPGAWSQIRTNSHSGSGPIDGSFSDSPSTAGSYWYGLHVFDKAGNVRYEPHPLGQYRVTATTTTECGSADKIRSTIQARLQFLVSSPAPEYLPASSWVAAIVSYKLQAYDETYFAALDMRGLANSALSRATRFLNAGDVNSACTYLQRANRYIQLMLDLESTSILVFNDRVTGVSEIARTIASESCKAEVRLVSSPAGLKLGLKASAALETVCMPLDYVLDRSMYGKDEALRRLNERIRTEVLAQVLFRVIPVPDLGGKTIDEYIAKGVKHEIGAPLLYKALGQIINNPNTKQELMKYLSFLGEQVVIDYGVDKLACEYLAWMEDSIGIATTNSQCPKLLQIISAEAEASTLPTIVETSPVRNAAFIRRDLPALTVTFSEPVIFGSRSVMLSDASGASVPISGSSIASNILTISLNSQLTAGTVYVVTIPTDVVRTADGFSNDQYNWRFSTPPPALSVGMKVAVSNTGGVGLDVRSSPSFLIDGSNVTTTLAEGQQLQIIGGPVRGDGFTWWNVTNGSLSGWCATGDWLSPNDLGGMRIGAEVTVRDTDGDGVALRDAPTYTGNTINRIQDGTKMVILSGPYYVDGYVWWNVSGDAGTGYASVAYWLFPLSSGNNAIEGADFFVKQHYTDFLSRGADQSGLVFWTNGITTCGADPACVEVKRVNTSAAFFLSIEFQQTGYLVYRMYKAAYGSMPNAPVPLTFSQFLTDTQPIRNGVVVNQGNWQQQLETNKQNFALEFVQRTRFITDYPASMTPSVFVDQLFSRAGVTPSTTDRNAAIAEFGGAANTTDINARARALRDVAENSTLNQQEFNRAFVLMQYFGYLRRNPYDAPEATRDYSGYNFWLGKLNQFNGNFIQAEMVKAFISSDEYRHRFGP